MARLLPSNKVEVPSVLLLSVQCLVVHVYHAGTTLLFRDIIGTSLIPELVL